VLSPGLRRAGVILTAVINSQARGESAHSALAIQIPSEPRGRGETAVRHVFQELSLSVRQKEVASQVSAKKPGGVRDVMDKTRRNPLHSLTLHVIVEALV
jgi:hypothetical protein